MKFLRYGSVMDAFRALKPHNILPTIGALSKNLSLAVMLMTDVFKSGAGKLHDIRHYYPEARHCGCKCHRIRSPVLRNAPLAQGRPGRLGLHPCRGARADHQEPHGTRSGVRALDPTIPLFCSGDPKTGKGMLQFGTEARDGAIHIIVAHILFERVAAQGIEARVQFMLHAVIDLRMVGRFVRISSAPVASEQNPHARVVAKSALLRRWFPTRRERLLACWVRPQAVTARKRLCRASRSSVVFGVRCLFERC